MQSPANASTSIGPIPHLYIPPVYVCCLSMYTTSLYMHLSAHTTCLCMSSVHVCHLSVCHILEYTTCLCMLPQCTPHVYIHQLFMYATSLGTPSVYVCHFLVCTTCLCTSQHTPHVYISHLSRPSVYVQQSGSIPNLYSLTNMHRNLPFSIDQSK